MEIGRYGMCSKRRLGNGVGSVNASVGSTELGIDIPEWLLMEVLIRLPVKLVFRCKLVSKKWLSIILDPYFIGMYVLRASMSPHSQTWTFVFMFMHEMDYDYPVYDLPKDVYLRDLKCPSLYAFRCPTYPIFEKYYIAGVSNGLLLYISCEGQLRDPCIFNICNPVTRQWISLPPCSHSLNRPGFVSRVEDGVLSSYRVVCIEIPVARNDIIRFKVFVSEINEWEDFNVHIDRAIKITCSSSPIALNGILHWVTVKHGIMAYDPYLSPDTLRFIALPCDRDPTRHSMRHGLYSLCDAHQGSLRYFEVSSGVCRNPLMGFSGIGVWMLNDYSTGDWCLQHQISANDILYDDILSFQQFLPKPLSFHPFDSEILYLGYESTLVSYNIKTRKLKGHGLPVDDSLCRASVFSPCWWLTYSFVFPPWPTSITPSSFGVSQD